MNVVVRERKKKRESMKNMIEKSEENYMNLD